MEACEKCGANKGERCICDEINSSGSSVCSNFAPWITLSVDFNTSAVTVIGFARNESGCEGHGERTDSALWESFQMRTADQFRKDVAAFLTTCSVPKPFEVIKRLAALLEDKLTSDELGFDS